MSSPTAELSFNNTEVAFQSKTNDDLKKAQMLFKLFNYKSLINSGPTLLNIGLKLRMPVKGLVKKTIFHQFCGGETIDECDKTSNDLFKYNIGTILDYSVEGEDDEADFDATEKEIIKTIAKAKGNKSIPFSVFKVTGIARFALLAKVNAKTELNDKEQAELTKAKNRFYNICEATYSANVRLFIDAEESWIQDTIDSWAEEMMEKYNKENAIIYNTLQMYRHDRLDYLKACHEKAKTGNYYLGYKIVRGAYMEKERARAFDLKYPSPINPTKEATDNLYNEAVKYCVEHVDQIHICAGTHNEQSSIMLAKLMDAKNIATNDERIYFAQLLGMSDHISYNLSHAGYNVAKYVPYGPVEAVIPYLVRRAQENSSVSGQTGRELGLIQKELKRRAS